jgi:hypothetical protein
MERDGQLRNGAIWRAPSGAMETNRLFPAWPRIGGGIVVYERLILKIYRLRHGPRDARCVSDDRRPAEPPGVLRDRRCIVTVL